MIWTMSSGETIQSHKDLIVWQKAMDLVVAIYELTSFFPKEEIYGLVSQMRRSAVSIPSNIAEGRKRGSVRDYRQFLIVALGSAAELETQIDIAKRLPFGKSLKYQQVDQLLLEVLKMLSKMTGTLKSSL